MDTLAGAPVDICTYALSIHTWSLLSKHLSHTCCVLGMCTLGTPPPGSRACAVTTSIPRHFPNMCPGVQTDGHSPCTHSYAHTDHSGVHVINTQALPCRDQLVFSHIYAVLWIGTCDRHTCTCVYPHSTTQAGVQIRCICAQRHMCIHSSLTYIQIPPRYSPVN